MESKEDRSIHISGGSQTNSPVTGTIEGDMTYNFSGNTTVNQMGELNDIIAELRKIQNQLELPNEKKQELESEIQTIESQAKSPKPKTQIIKESLSSARGILEQASGVAAAAAPLIARIGSWLMGVP